MSDGGIINENRINANSSSKIQHVIMEEMKVE